MTDLDHFTLEEKSIVAQEIIADHWITDSNEILSTGKTGFEKIVTLRLIAPWAHACFPEDTQNLVSFSEMMFIEHWNAIITARAAL